MYGGWPVEIERFINQTPFAGSMFPQQSFSNQSCTFLQSKDMAEQLKADSTHLRTVLNDFSASFPENQNWRPLAEAVAWAKSDLREFSRIARGSEVYSVYLTETEERIKQAEETLRNCMFSQDTLS